jgi:HSP20 family protein
MNTLLKKRGNGNGFPSLRSNLSDLFDIENFFTDSIFSKPMMADTLAFGRLPATNIRETEKEYIVELAAPGLKKKDFVVEVNNDCLEIKVEKEKETEEKGNEFTRREYNYSAFFRSFALPATVNAEKSKAEYENGILKVHLPKIADAKRKPAKEIAVE